MAYAHTEGSWKAPIAVTSPPMQTQNVGPFIQDMPASPYAGLLTVRKLLIYKH